MPDAPVLALGLPYRIANEAQLRAAAALRGVNLGSHTWSHSNLASLDAPQLERELRTSHEWLRERFASYVPWLSYPYGLFSSDVERVAREVGYAGSLMVAGGWVGDVEACPAHQIPRFNVPANLSLDGFLLRLSGLGAR
jgi:peptidoglycan/xylan/chitin deacetylase (PgdA/CDA1 family)